MKDQVSWVLELAVKDGQLDTFKALMEEMVDGASSEPGTFNYEWYISDDGGTIHIYEKYADSDAMIRHVNGFFEKWAGRFMDAIEVKQFVVYGAPSEDARGMLDQMGARYLQPWGGFAREPAALAGAR